MTIRPDKKRISWDSRETVGYSSMPEVMPDGKIRTDYFGNVIEGGRMPGPFVVREDEAVLSIDPRKR